MRLKTTLVLGLMAVVGCSAPAANQPVQPPPVELLADLVVVAHASTLAVDNGKTLNVSVTVKNKGAAASLPVVGRWTLEGAELDVATTVSVPALEVGRAEKVAFHYPFAATQSGRFVLRFSADPDGRLAESNTANNQVKITIKVAPQPILPPPLASLAVTFAVDSLTFDKNSFVVAEVSVSNLGVDPVPIEGLWELQGPGMDFSKPVTGLVLNGFETYSLLFQEPADPTKRGRFFLKFTAHPAGTYVELDEADNTDVVEVLIVPFPDLQAEILSASPLAVSSAAPAMVTVRWSNQGYSPVTYSAAVTEPAKLYLVKSGESVGGLNLMAPITVPVLAPGAVTTVSYEVQALRGAGNYAWIVSAPAVADEVPVANNVATLTGTVVDSPLITVWTAAVTSPNIASPITAAVNGDGTWDLFFESLTPAETRLHAVDGASGAELWAVSSGGLMLATPAYLRRPAGDAVVKVGWDDRTLAALAVADGNLLWSQTVGSTFSSPVAVDFDQDGFEDVVVAGDEYVWVVSGNGAVLATWPIPATSGAFMAPPAIADLNADTLPDIVLASDNGLVYALMNSAATSVVAAWEQTVGPSVFAGPSVADLAGDGTLDVVIADNAGGVHVFAAATGAYEWSVSTSVERFWQAQATARLSAGPGLALVVSGTDPASSQHDWVSSLLAFDGADGTLLWSLRRPGTPGPVVSIDIDNDGRDELLWFVSDRVPGIYPLDLPATSGAQGRLFVVGSDGRILTVFETPGAVWATPLAGDLDGDQLLDIVLATQGLDGVMTRIGTPWAWGPERAWVGYPGVAPHPGYERWP